MKICTLCSSYNKSYKDNSYDCEEISSGTNYNPKNQDNSSKKKINNPRRDLGKNNSVRRKHLDIKDHQKFPISENNKDIRTLIQGIVDKIEHKFKHCEKFLADNQDDLSLSYYSEGYYNGRARAFEDTLDLIEEVLQKVYMKE